VPSAIEPKPLYQNRWRSLLEVIDRHFKPDKLTDETYLSAYPSVAKLPDTIVTNIFTLKRSLIECIDSTTAMEFRLFQQVGETAETLVLLVYKIFNVIGISHERQI
jgi:hypothetical protein